MARERQQPRGRQQEGRQAAKGAREAAGAAKGQIHHLDLRRPGKADGQAGQAGCRPAAGSASRLRQGPVAGSGHRPRGAQFPPPAQHDRGAAVRRLPACRPACSPRSRTARLALARDTASSLSRALQVPVTIVFSGFRGRALGDLRFRRGRACPLNGGVPAPGTNTSCGPWFQPRPCGRALSGDAPPKTLDVFPIFQHDGVEFLYILQGEVGYRHGDKLYHMRPVTASISIRTCPMGRNS